MAYIRLYHPSDAGEVISLDLRKADRDEIVAATGKSEEQVLEDALTYSEITWVIIDNQHNISGVFGLSRGEDIEGNPLGIPWLLTTDSMDDFKYAFSKYSWDVIEIMTSRYSYLTNYVDSRHKKAIKWLRWLGFTIHTDEPITLYDETVTFYRFSMVRGDKCYV